MYVYVHTIPVGVDVKEKVGNALGANLFLFSLLVSVLTCVIMHECVKLQVIRHIHCRSLAIYILHEATKRASKQPPSRLRLASTQPPCSREPESNHQVEACFGR